MKTQGTEGNRWDQVGLEIVTPWWISICEATCVNKNNKTKPLSTIHVTSADGLKNIS